MKLRRIRSLLYATFVITCASASRGTVISDISDTYATDHYNLGGPASIHGSDPMMAIIGPFNGVHATPLVRFDLSGFAGQTVTGNATLQLYLDTSWNPTEHPTCTQLIELHQELSVWNEATSWNSLPGPNGVMDPTILDSKTVTFDGLSDYPSRWISWTLPGSVVQSWIDHPANNNGLVLVSDTQIDLQDLWFSSREGDNAPQLVFATVPEPSCLILAVAMSAFVLSRRNLSRL